jgi:hypothetical protein
VDFLRSSTPRTRGRRFRLGLSGAAAKLLGTTVDAAIPLQRHPPLVILVVSVAELLALAGLIITGSLIAMLILLAISAVVVILVATNKRQILVITRQGNILLSASHTAWPNGVVGPADRTLLPEPKGVGVPFVVAGQTWWIDRSSYRSLTKARAVEAAEREQ